MYLRHSTRRKDGKTHTYWRLVRSVRRNGKVVQETVAQLGELDSQGRAKARALARTITGKLDQPDLFEEPTAEQTVAVQLNRIRLERGRSLEMCGWRGLSGERFGSTSFAGSFFRRDGSRFRGRRWWRFWW